MIQPCVVVKQMLVVFGGALWAEGEETSMTLRAIVRIIRGMSPIAPYGITALLARAGQSILLKHWQGPSVP